MKKLVLVLALVVMVAGVAFSQDFIVRNSRPLMAPGSVAASIGVNFGYWYGIGIGGGVEYSLGQINIPDLFPLTYGLAIRGAADFGSHLYAGVGALAVLHLSTTAFNLPSWAQKFDFFSGLGLGLGLGWYSGLGFAWTSGVNYFFTPNLAVRVETLSLHSLWGNYLGIQFKI